MYGIELKNFASALFGPVGGKQWHGRESVVIGATFSTLFLASSLNSDRSGDSFPVDTPCTFRRVGRALYAPSDIRSLQLGQPDDPFRRHPIHVSRGM